MQQVSTLPFSHLKNTEHVSFFSNVMLVFTKIGIESLGISTQQYQAFKNAVDMEQDVVNRSLASVYTPEMKACDDERDRIFRMIRFKLQAATMVSPVSDIYDSVNTIEKYILSKYGLDVVTAPYQEESALIRGFIFDTRNHIGTTTLKAIAIDDDLNDLEMINEEFASMYNERVTEKAMGNDLASRTLRAATEDSYGLIALHLQYKSNAEGNTETGKTCATVIDVINQLIKDARQRLNSRLGRGEVFDEPDFSPIPYPVKQS